MSYLDRFVSLGVVAVVCSGAWAEDYRASLLADADGRAGRDGSFFIENADGSAKLKLGGYMQFRYYANVRGDDASERVTNGFVSERTRLVVAGNLDERTSFLFLNCAGPSGSFVVLDAWVKEDLGDGWAVSAGQFKLPFLREWLVSERYILAVERSILSGACSSIYSQGLQLHYTGESVRANIAYSDGLRAANTDFTAPIEADWALTGRVEWLLDGSWGQFKDITSLGNTERGLMVGVAGHVQGETDSLFGLAMDSLAQATVDVSYEAEDWSIEAGGVTRHIELSGGGDITDFAASVQGGVFVSENVELVGRATVLIPDPDAAADDPFPAFTAGVNWYLMGHALRMKLDAEWFPTDLADTTFPGLGPSTGVGLIGGADGGEVVFRGEVQLMF